MNRKGFTLIELLTVIIVLGIIALITTPIIVDTVNESKERAFEDTASGVLITAKQTYLDYAGNKMRIDMQYKCISLNEGDCNINFSHNGELPENGYVEIDEQGNATMIVYSDAYCAYKLDDSDPIQVKKIKSAVECRKESLEK